MILEAPAADTWTVEDLEKLHTGDPEYWIVDRHPDGPDDALVKIHHLIRGGGAVYRQERTVPLSTLEREEA